MSLFDLKELKKFLPSNHKITYLHWRHLPVTPVKTRKRLFRTSVLIYTCKWEHILQVHIEILFKDLYLRTPCTVHRILKLYQDLKESFFNVLNMGMDVTYSRTKEDLQRSQTLWSEFFFFETITLFMF